MTRKLTNVECNYRWEGESHKKIENKEAEDDGILVEHLKEGSNRIIPVIESRDDDTF